MNDTNDVNLIKEKVQFYFREQFKIHIKVLNSIFYNGTIKEISKNFLILIDDKLGDIPIFFEEIIRIEPRRYD